MEHPEPMASGDVGIRSDPNLAMVELIAQALGPLREQLVFVGGCAAGLLLTDPAAGLAPVTCPGAWIDISR